MLLNLMAALSLASIGAVAGIASNSLLVDNVELDKCSLIERKNANTFFIPTNGVPVFYLNHGVLSENVFFDGVLHFYDYVSLGLNFYSVPSGVAYGLSGSTTAIRAMFDVSGFDSSISNYGDQFIYFIDGHLLSLDSSAEFTSIFYDNFRSLKLLIANDDPILSVIDWDNARLTILKSTYTWADYEASHQIVSGIASGLTSVQHYATSLVSGFDALALDNGALTNSMAFAFTLLGIGTAVGICKLAFNWITGRHGM